MGKQMRKLLCPLLILAMILSLAGCLPKQGNTAAVIDLSFDPLVAGLMPDDITFSVTSEGTPLNHMVLWEDNVYDNPLEGGVEYTINVNIFTPEDYNNDTTTINYLNDFGTVESFKYSSTVHGEKVFEAIIKVVCEEEEAFDTLEEGAKLVVNIDCPEIGDSIFDDYSATITAVASDGTVLSEREIYQVVWEGDNVDYDNPEQKFDPGTTYTVRINFEGYDNWDTGDTMTVTPESLPAIEVNDGYTFNSLVLYAMMNFGISFDYTFEECEKLVCDIAYPKAGDKIRADYAVSITAVGANDKVLSKRDIYQVLWEGDNVDFDDPNQKFEAGKTYTIRINFDGFYSWEPDNGMTLTKHPEVVVNDGYQFKSIVLYAMTNYGISFDYTIPKNGEDKTEATTEKKTEATTERTTESTTESTTEKKPEATTQQKTEVTTEKPTEQKTEATTEKPTEQKTEATTEAPSHNHKYTAKYEASAVRGDVHFAYCECGDKVEQKHNLKVLKASVSTCSEHGYAYSQCTLCGAYYDEELPLDPNNHNYKYDPTYYGGICVYCGHHEIDGN